MSIKVCQLGQVKMSPKVNPEFPVTIQYINVLFDSITSMPCKTNQYLIDVLN